MNKPAIHVVSLAALICTLAAPALDAQITASQGVETVPETGVEVQHFASPMVLDVPLPVSTIARMPVGNMVRLGDLSGFMCDDALFVQTAVLKSTGTKKLDKVPHQRYELRLFLTVRKPSHDKRVEVRAQLQQGGAPLGRVATFSTGIEEGQSKQLSEELLLPVADLGRLAAGDPPATLKLTVSARND
jgi:hypothetical protein